MVSLKYDLSAYDQYCSLKPPVGLIAIILFLCRALVLPLAMYLAAMNQYVSSLRALIYGGSPVFSIVGAVPAVLVLYALRGRRPGAGIVTRWLWKRGPLMLTAAVLIQAFPLIQALWLEVSGPLGESSADSTDAQISVCVLALYLGILFYLFTSHRTRDAFRAFPEAGAPENVTAL